MSYNVEITEHFKKDLKPLLKKYASLKSKISEMGKVLVNNPEFGIHLGDNVYKIRIAISSKGKGKSGGARIITYVKVINETIYLIAIYSKGEKDSISSKEITELLKAYI